MSQHDDHPPDAPEPHDGSLPPGESPAEAPDPFLELERMFGDLAGPPSPVSPDPDPPALAAPATTAPRIEPARLEMPPLLQEEAELDAPEMTEAIGMGSEPARSASGSATEGGTETVETHATLDWGHSDGENPHAESGFEAAPAEISVMPEAAARPAEALEAAVADEPPTEASVVEAPIVETSAIEVPENAPEGAPETHSQEQDDVPVPPTPQPSAPAPSPGALDELVAMLDVQTPPAEDVTLAASSATPAPVGQRCILFELDGTRYALQMGQVVEVADVPPVTPLPHVPAWLLGVSNLRGDILAVLDLRLFLDLGPRPSSATARMLIVQGAVGLHAGLVVDSVHGVASVDMQALQPPTAPMDDPVLPLLRGVHQQNDRLLAVLDTNRLLTSDALKPFAASQAGPGAAQSIDAPASAAANTFSSTS